VFIKDCGKTTPRSLLIDLN